MLPQTFPATAIDAQFRTPLGPTGPDQTADVIQSILMTNEPSIDEHAAIMSEMAAKTAKRFFRGTLGVEFKQDESPVTQADRAVEADIRRYLKIHFPDHGIFGEEQGREDGNSDRLWVIDPIDGTRSFLSGNPLFGFLLAHLAAGRTELGIIGMPALNETFIGVRDKGATLNGTPIRTSRTASMDDAILYINEAEKIYRDHPEVFDRLLQTGQTRRFAYDCYPHALVAAGHVDAVIDYDLQPYDFLSVSAVIEAAGGIMSDWKGQPLSLASDGAVISAANPSLHAELLSTLAG